MNYTLKLVALLSAMMFCFCAYGQVKADMPGSLKALVDLEGLPVVNADVRDGMFSSTDPTGHGHDHGHYLRVDGDEYVLCEMDGPGVVTRIWSANAQGTLRIYLDDKNKPAIECLFKDFFEDRVAPFQSPITGKSSGGWYSYWPIGYKKYCKITVTQDPEISRKQKEALEGEKVSVSVKGVKELKLIVGDAGDGYGNDHADWADAKLTRADGSILYLSDVTEKTPDVKLVSTKQGWRKLMMDKSVDGNELSINGTKFEKGLGTHSVGETVYKLSGAFEKFESVIGLDDEIHERHEGTVICMVEVDGKQVYESKALGFIKPEGSLKAPSLYYHVNYRTYPEGTKILPFSRKLSSSEKKHLETALGLWKNNGVNPISPQRDDKTIEKAVTIKGGKSATIAAIDGSGFIYSLKAKLTSDDPRAYRRTVVKIFWDGEKKPSVWAPYGDFFGSGFGHVEFNALPFGMGKDTTNKRTVKPLKTITDLIAQGPISKDECYSYWVMPFAKGARIEIENGSTTPVQIETEITWRKTSDASNKNIGRFCAQWRNEVGKEGLLLTLLDVKGAGKFVGLVVSAQGLAEISYLEGNEQYFIDGEEKPSMIGTGTEDFFNGGWYYNEGLFDRPLHGLTEKENTMKGRTSQYRLQTSDSVTFRKEFKLLMEHGSSNIHIDDDFATTTYFYMVPPYSLDYQPPAASEMNFPRKVLVRPNLPGRGAIGDRGGGVIKMRGGRFAEHVFDISKASCKKELRFWKDISEGYEGTNMAMFMWWPRVFLIRNEKEDPRIKEPYRGDVIICEGKKAGDYLEIPSATSDESSGMYIGRYWLVCGPDYGQVKISVGKKVVAKMLDLYSEEVGPSEMVAIGLIELPDGPKTLKIEVVGKNKDSKGMKFGLYVEKTIRALILPKAWKVIGPFPFDSLDKNASFAVAFPPEKELVFDTKYKGKTREVAWREMPVTMVEDEDYQNMDFIRGIPNANDAMAYAHAYIDVPAGVTATMKIGHNRPVAVFLNGEKIYEKIVMRPYIADQDSAQLQFKKGTNSLLIKTANERDEWKLDLRFVDTEGRPIKGLRFVQD